MVNHTDRLRCPFCLEELAYLDNPKQLRCGHICCLLCLEGHLKVTENGKQLIECPICSESYEVDTLESLPEAQSSEASGVSEPVAKRLKLWDEAAAASTSGITVEVINPDHKCSACKGKDVMSVSYCISCDKKLCAQHEQSHDELFESDAKHKKISIQKYCEKPKLYTRSLCEEHDKELGMCCKFCFTLKCPNCLTINDCSESETDDQSHTFISLQDVEEQIKSEFAEELKKVSQTITTMCKIEKQAWLRMDEVEEECQRLTKNVETAAQKLMVFLKSWESKLRERIETFRQVSKYHAEERLEKLRQQRVDLEENMASCEAFSNSSHITKMIEERGQMLASVEDQDFPITAAMLPKMEALKDEITKLETLDSHLTSGGIHLLSSKDVDTDSFDFPGLSATEDGRIIYVCGHEVFIESADKKNWLKLYEDPGRKVLVSICYDAGNLYFVETLITPGGVDHAVLCIKNILDMDKWDELEVSEIFPFTHHEDQDGNYDPPNISVTGNMVALTCNDKLVFFDLVTKAQYTQIYCSGVGLRSAVALPMNNFCTTHGYSVVKFDHNGRVRRRLKLDSMRALRICRWKGDYLLLLFLDLKDQHIRLALLDSDGKELARFSHELLQYYLQSGPICAHGNRVTLFNSDCSAVMTFEIDYEKEKN